MLVKTYTVKMQNGCIWQFKYALNGVLVFFNVMDGDLNEKQQKYLYIDGNFPWLETHIKLWQNKYKTITIEVGEPDLSFDCFWKMYPFNPLSKKKLARERWEKLSEADRIKILLSIPKYIKLKQQDNTKFPYAEVFINQRWWEN